MTISTVAASTSSVVLRPTNFRRQHLMIFNESTAVLYLAFDLIASATSYSLQIPPGGFVNFTPPMSHTGAVSGLWATANGFARITEI